MAFSGIIRCLEPLQPAEPISELFTGPHHHHPVKHPTRLTAAQHPALLAPIDAQHFQYQEVLKLYTPALPLLSALKFVGRWALEERNPWLHHRFGNIETC